MKNIKKYESFLDFFKIKKKEIEQKPLNIDEFVLGCIKIIMQETELTESEIKRTIRIPSGEIEFNRPLISLKPPYIAKYEINLENPNKLFSKLIIAKCLGYSGPGWTKEAEERWINDGAFLGNENDIYKIQINDINIICDPENAFKLFQVIDIEYYFATGYLKRYKFSNNWTKTNNKNIEFSWSSDDGNFGNSANIGGLTGNPLLGGSVGGGYTGGLFGSMFGD